MISGGYNIYPKEVEGEIDRIEGVVESAVIGVPHPDFGEGVTAIIVLKPGFVLDEKTTVGALQDRLSRYKQPKRIVFADDLPRNAMGKVQKNILRQQYADLYTRTERDSPSGKRVRQHQSRTQQLRRWRRRREGNRGY